MNKGVIISLLIGAMIAVIIYLTAYYWQKENEE